MTLPRIPLVSVISLLVAFAATLALTTGISRLHSIAGAIAPTATASSAPCTLQFGRAPSSCDVIAASPPSTPILWKRDVTFAKIDGVPLELDVARTSVTAHGRPPVVVLVHGGGWWSGARSDFATKQTIQQSFTRAGFVTISIDYRLACGDGPGANYRGALGTGFNAPSPLCGAYLPDQVADIRTAIAYVRRHADELAIDPNRIALFGASSGGHLALLAAETADRGSRVQAAINWSGAAVLDDVAREQPEQRGTIVASLTNAVGWRRSACEECWLKADPMKSLRYASYPFAAFGAASTEEHAVSTNSLGAYDRAIAKRGWPHELRSVVDTCHGSGCFDKSVNDGHTLMNATIAFLTRTFQPHRARSTV